MNRRLITAALPYVNNIPHLGNIIQSLSGDVFARFCRSRGYDTLYVCGVDEYGTATETKALEEKTDPRSLCDHYYGEHTKIYEWFKIDFDKFGRTSNEQCTEITQSLFNDLDKAGLIHEHVNKQLFCPHCNMFLADRYVDGTCPKCGYEKARGDQCDKCGSLLDPTELKEPRCHTCGGTPEVRETKHLYIDLPAMSGKLNEWMEKASVDGRWADNAINMTKAWIRDGLQERAITRDLKWGIPVPKPGYENKVFYVWFNAPIGYISITKQLADELVKAGKQSFDWKSWWIPSESEEGKNKPKVDLFQFIGKDNIPFHTVIFPSTLLGSPHEWTKLHHMSSTEFLNYEDGKFSKSLGVGVFGSDAIESGIPADAWRFYIFYNRPEKQDYQFTWKDFMEKLNGELIGNLGNLVNRTLLFVNKYYEGKIPDAPVDEELWTKVRELEAKATASLEWADLKDAFHTMFEISDICNKKFQATEPWKARTENPAIAESLIHNLCYVIKDLMIMMNPYMPQYTQKIMSYFGKTIQVKKVGMETQPGYTWEDLGKLEGLTTVGPTEVYFKPMDQKTMLAFREKFSGKQKKSEAKPKNEKKAEKKEAKEPEPLPPEQQKALYNEKIMLKVAKITEISRHPDAEKLYVEKVDDGTGVERIICSGLVPYLKEEELLGKHVVIADNLKPRKLRGIESRGMLLAADYKDSEGNEKVEVLECPWAKPGTPVVLKGAAADAAKPEAIDADTFFAVQIAVAAKKVGIHGTDLVADGKEIVMQHVENGEVC
ncbi:MAG: methionine--tRNA ligase [Spirochaetales bacterium]|nr:methionine--tRNA ligase [Spirochaetales bacterium]